MRIAIVGGGISGLTVAYRLHAEHEVTLFEANDYLGGHTNTVDIDTPNGPIPIDTGFIVFNDRTYPQFSALLQELQVQSTPTQMGFSVRCDQSGLEYCGSDLPALFAQPTNLLRPRFHRMLWDIVRFNRHLSATAEELDEALTVREFLGTHRFSKMFVQQHFLPMASAIWSCPCGVIEDFPVKFIAEFYKHHGLLSLTNRPQWLFIRGGSRMYVKAMTRNFQDRIQLSCPVTSVRRTEQGVDVVTARFGQSRFDHVVMACHSDQALKILGSDASTTERAVLSQFHYERNQAVLHSDVSVLPRRRRAWASWNYWIRKQHQAGHDPVQGVAAGKVTVTYNMNILQNIKSSQTYCVSLNCESEIRADKVLRNITYHHPVFTARRSEAQRRHAELLNHRHTSYCGAYWGNGFHEDGVVSGMAVCAAISRIRPQSAGPEVGLQSRRRVPPGSQLSGSRRAVP